MGCLMRWALSVVAVLIAVYLAKALGLVLYWEPEWRVIIFVPVLAVVNAVLGTVLRIMSLPVTLLTFGLFGFVINALMFWLAGWLTGASMNFWSALFGSVVTTFVGGWLDRLVRRV